MNETDELFANLSKLIASDVGPFPYADCRKLQGDDKYPALIPDLDTYLSEMAGYRSW